MHRVGNHFDGPAEYGSLLQQSAQFNEAAGGGSLTTIALASLPTPQPGAVDPDARRQEALVDQITSLCDDLIPLYPNGISHIHGVPISFNVLATRTAQLHQPPALRTYVRRARSLLMDVSHCITVIVFVDC